MKPAHQRPELPDFWDHRFRSGTTPWEAGEVPVALREFALEYASGSSGNVVPHAPINARPQPARILVPGCGRAFDAAYLVRQGWSVTALDFSEEAVQRARSTVGETWPGTLLCADFFTFAAAPFDVIYERAFLCALPRHLWPAYGRRVVQLLRPGGLLAGFFYFSTEAKGPPFGLQAGQLDELLRPDLARMVDRPVSASLPVFAGGERWQIWRRE